jgi:hypothetical protein
VAVVSLLAVTATLAITIGGDRLATVPEDPRVELPEAGPPLGGEPLTALGVGIPGQVDPAGADASPRQVARRVQSEPDSISSTCGPRATSSTTCRDLRSLLRGRPR